MLILIWDSQGQIEGSNAEEEARLFFFFFPSKISEGITFVLAKYPSFQFDIQIHPLTMSLLTCVGTVAIFYGMIIFEVSLCFALYNDNFLVFQNVLLIFADSILGPGCMELNGPRTVRRRESVNHIVKHNSDDPDPWPAWAYKPRTISLLLIGACLLM